MGLQHQKQKKSHLQHHSSKASILEHSAFFMVQLSHPYMTTGKTHSFDYTDLCCQSDVFLHYTLLFTLSFYTLLFTPSRFVIAFLPRIKYLLISWLYSLSAVIFEGCLYQVSKERPWESDLVLLHREAGAYGADLGEQEGWKRGTVKGGCIILVRSIQHGVPTPCDWEDFCREGQLQG